jgi:sortase (surface protein transpeptidase)
MTCSLARGLVRFVIASLLAALAVTGLTEAAVAAPERLVIPKIGVDAPIIRVPVVSGSLAIGNDPKVTYTPRRGDPLCDPLGTTIIAGHTYRAGDGVADNWRTLKKGDRLRAGGCQFVVEYKVLKPGSTRIKHLMRYDGPPTLWLIGCNPDNYGFRYLIKLRMVRRR